MAYELTHADVERYKELVRTSQPIPPDLQARIDADTYFQSRLAAGEINLGTTTPAPTAPTPSITFPKDVTAIDASYFNTQLSAYQKSLEEFNKKYEPLIKVIDDKATFTGTRDQYTEYLRERNALLSSYSALGRIKNVAEVKSGIELQQFETSLAQSDPELYEIYKEHGIEALNQAIKEREQSAISEFYKNNVVVPIAPSGSLPIEQNYTFITRESFNKLSPESQKVVVSKGLTALNVRYGQASDAAALLPKDVYEIYKEQSARDKFDILRAYGAIPPDTKYMGEDASGNPKFKRGTDASEIVADSENFPLLAADVLIPGFATVRHWNEMSTGEKALSIALDALVLAPIISGAARGARASAALTRAGTMLAAAKGAGKEALLYLRSPIDTVLHPIESVKSTVGGTRNLIENLVSFRKLPEAVITTTHGTVRIPVSEVGSAEEAKRIRDTLMELAAKGDNPVIEANGVRYELSRSALMKELKGGLAHTTPMGEAFDKELVVAFKEGMPLSEQGLFLSHEPLPRFAEISAFGKQGEKPAIVILSPEIAKDAVSSEKLYRGTAELESVLKPGYKLPKATQRLYTRIGPNHTRVEILIVGNKLSPAQIVKLKGLAIIEDLKAMISPKLMISDVKFARELTGEALSADDVETIVRELRAAGQTEAADALLRANRIISSTARVTVPTSDRLVATGTIRTGERPLKEVIAIRASGEPKEPVRADMDSARADTTLVYRTSGVDNIAGRVDVDRGLREEASNRLMREPEFRSETHADDQRISQEDRVIRSEDERKTPPPDVTPPRRTTDIPPPERVIKTPPPPDGGIRRVPSPEEKKSAGTYTPDSSKAGILGRPPIVLKQGWAYWIIEPPYRQENVRVSRTPPEGAVVYTGIGSAYKAIQALGGDVDVLLNMDIGIMDVKIDKPSAKPGRKGALRYRLDKYQRTHGDITARGVRMS